MISPGRISRRSRGRRRSMLLAAVAVSVLAIAGCGSDTASSGPGAGSGQITRGSTTPLSAASLRRHPNIVFVLTDDLSMNLLRYMPQVRALQHHGLTFDNYYVSDSLCCPSRSSIFTGDFPHDTGVFTNAGPGGGIKAFYAHHDESHTFNVALQQAGYRTAMMGKYLNGYLQGKRRSPIASTAVPPGWSEWDVAGFAYGEFNYELNQDGKLHHYGHTAQDYLTNVLARRGTRFVDQSARAHRPFFLELATFSPHAPYTPAPRDRHAFPGLMAPRPPSFDELPVDAPSWLAAHRPLRPRQLSDIDRVFRRRAQDVLSVDRLISTIRQAVAARGLSRRTYIVFSSDNGLHAGEYRLMPGKLTAFDTDIHVPLVVDGPHIRPGSRTHAMAENVDLAKTFESMAGTAQPSDGRSLAPLLRGGTPSGWRDAVLVEHRGPAVDNDDPDRQDHASGNPTTYEAMRTRQFLYVEYRNGQREFYDLGADPFELHNIAGSLPAARLSQLHSELARLRNCHSGSACWSAEHVTLGDRAALRRWRVAVHAQFGASSPKQRSAGSAGDELRHRVRHAHGGARKPR